MATTTKIPDVIEPAVYLNYRKEYNPVNYDAYTLLNTSAVGNALPEVTSQLAAGGSVIDMPFWQDTTRAEPQAQTDDDTVSITPLKITATKMRCRKIYWSQAWSQSDLAGAFATGNTGDPLRQIIDYTENYWRSSYQISAIKVMDGVCAWNVASASGDMRYSVYSDIATPLAANKFSGAALNGARATMGERGGRLKYMLMNSKVFYDLQNLEQIAYIRPSQVPFDIPTYQGIQIVFSDDCTVVAGTNSPMYRTYLLGEGVMQISTHFPEIPIETFRNPDKGNGGGVTTLYQRRHAIVHVNGMSFTGTPAGKSPTWAEFATAGNWARAYQRRNIQLAFLETN